MKKGVILLPFLPNQPGFCKKVRLTMISMCSQSAPAFSILFASEARHAKSHESIDGAIFAGGAIFARMK